MSDQRRCFKLTETTIRELKPDDLFILNGGEADHCKADILYRATSYPRDTEVGIALIECDEVGKIDEATKPKA